MKKEQRWLSKSQINTYLQCPLKWKFLYIDKFPSFSSPQQNRGKQIHEKIENFYKNINVVKEEGKPVIKLKSEDDDLKNFVELERNRIISCVNEKGEYDKTYFEPVFQELRLANKELMLRGIIDAVYIHPKDKKAIVIDWKTGKFNKRNLNDYRFELAVYKELLEKDKKLDVEVGYWGIFFTDANKLFFEKVEQKYINKMYKTIEKVRKGIEEKNYIPKPNFFCRWCQFADKCPGGQYVVQ